MPLGLYLHFPFCRNHCSYCDFYKELFDAGREALFYEALRLETELCAESIGEGDREIGTIFIGGGTPSLSNLDFLADWLALVRKLFVVPEGIEFSIETNPESVTLEKLTAFQQMGVNRPLFGVQSFNPNLLKLLNRKHIPEDSYRAVYYTNALGFSNFGVDLIFGLPGQSMKMLSSDIDEIVELNPPHISFYQLTVEAGTPLAKLVESGKLVMPSQESSMGMYRGGVEKFVEAGYHRYEVSSLVETRVRMQTQSRLLGGAGLPGTGAIGPFIHERPAIRQLREPHRIYRLPEGRQASGDTRRIRSRRSNGGGDHAGIPDGQRDRPAPIRFALRPVTGIAIGSAQFRLASKFRTRGRGGWDGAAVGGGDIAGGRNNAAADQVASSRFVIVPSTFAWYLVSHGPV